MPVILVEGVWKSFGPTVALQGVDLAVEQGSIQALLGRNGAGKTTLVRILATLLEPDAGSVRIGGADVVRDAQRVRSLIGLAGQSAAVDPTLTGRENLELVGRLYGLPGRTARERAQEVLEQLSLTAAADQRVLTYSGGMRRRIDVGASLVGRPTVLIMDEPTTGLDPGARRALWRLVEELAQEGTTVLLTTQYLEEADHLATRIAVLEGGRMIASGTPAELKDRIGQDVLEVRAGSGVDVERVRRMLVGLGSGEPVVDTRWHKVTLPTRDAMSTLLSASRRIETSGIAVEDLGLRRPTLDEVFLTLTANGDGDRANGDGMIASPPSAEDGQAPEDAPRRPRRATIIASLAVAALAVVMLIFVSQQSSAIPQKAAARPRKAAGLRQTLAGHSQAVAVHRQTAGRPPQEAAAHAQPVTSISSISEGRTIVLGAAPGGLTADASGNIWASLPAKGEVVRVARGTGHTQTFLVGGHPTAIAAAFDRVWVAGSSLGPLASLNIVTGESLSSSQLSSTPVAITLDDDDQSLCTIDSSGTLTHLTSTGVVAGTAGLARAMTAVSCGEGWVWAAGPSPPALVRMADFGGARQFNGGPAPVAITFDQGAWIANRNGTVTVFDASPSQLRVTRAIAVAPELDGIYAVENDPSVWAFSQQTRTVYRISNAAPPTLTATVAFSSPPVAILRIGQSVWVATQDGHLTQVRY